MMKFFNLAVTVLGLGAVGCGGGDEGPTDDACLYVRGETYSTAEPRECGAGRPDCLWYVELREDSTYSWSFSDTPMAGTYECSGLNIVRTSDGKKLGSYDPSTGVLTWNGVPYQAQ